MSQAASRYAWKPLVITLILAILAAGFGVGAVLSPPWPVVVLWPGPSPAHPDVTALSDIPAYPDAIDVTESHVPNSPGHQRSFLTKDSREAVLSYYSSVLASQALRQLGWTGGWTHSQPDEFWTSNSDGIQLISLSFAPDAAGRTEAVLWLGARLY